MASVVKIKKIITGKILIIKYSVWESLAYTKNNMYKCYLFSPFFLLKQKIKKLMLHHETPDCRILYIPLLINSMLLLSIQPKLSLQYKIINSANIKKNYANIDIGLVLFILDEFMIL
jgi:hypothetical protein